MLVPRVSSTQRVLPSAPTLNGRYRSQARGDRTLLSISIYAGTATAIRPQTRHFSDGPHLGFWWSRQPIWNAHITRTAEGSEKRQKPLKSNSIERTQYAVSCENTSTHRYWGGRRSSSWGPRSRFSRLIVSRHSLPVEQNQGQPENGPFKPTPEHAGATEQRPPKQGQVADRRKQPEEDPFTALFGRRIERRSSQGIWPSLNIHKVLGWVTSRIDPVEDGHASKQEADKGRPATQRRSPNTGRSDLSSDLAGKRREHVLKVEDDFEIDPISLRKVARTPTRKGHATIIPVKTYDAQRTRTETGRLTTTPSAEGVTKAKEEKLQVNPHDPVAAGLKGYDETAAYSEWGSAATASKDWLVKEGFATHQTPAAVKNGATPTEDAAPRSSSPPETATATERISADLSLTEAPLLNERRPELIYDERESREEDLDLLRSSDVRAGSGILKRPSVETEAEKESRRHRLEEDYTHAIRSASDHVDEVAAQQYAQSRRHDKQQLSDADISNPSALNDVENHIQSLERDYASDLQAQLSTEDYSSSGAVESTHKPSDKSPGASTDVSSLRGEGDLTAEAGQYAKNTQFQESVVQVSQTKDKKQQEKELVREIRHIYEDTYGVLDSTHRQSKDNSTSSQGTHRDTVDEALQVHDRKLGPGAYQFTTGQDALEQELLARDKNEGSSRSEPSSESSRKRDEEQALLWEQKEQILHEEVGEGAALLHDVEVELNQISNKLERLQGTGSKGAPYGFNEPTVYKVLAYDPAADKINTAIAHSSGSAPSPIGSEENLSAPEVLLRLNKPAKFLQYFTPLQAEGYEIASGGGDVLVFKKVHDGEPPAVAPPTSPARKTNVSDLPRYPFVNPIDGTTTGNFASPTGFVNYDTVFPSPITEETGASTREQGPLSSTVKVRKEEDVFSGQQKWSEEKTEPKKPGRMRQVARRAFFVGLWVAGCSYALGVMAEFGRTGGSSGTGMQGL
ncbi:MAG: hypothetical protein M1817_006156 [Caeruleum heppii]|nr:MAG: hypothetical protein M1817_006156 [Caeruleum heppii]